MIRPALKDAIQSVLLFRILWFLVVTAGRCIRNSDSVNVKRLWSVSGEVFDEVNDEIKKLY